MTDDPDEAFVDLQHCGEALLSVVAPDGAPGTWLVRMMRTIPNGRRLSLTGPDGQRPAYMFPGWPEDYDDPTRVADLLRPFGGEVLGRVDTPGS